MRDFFHSLKFKILVGVLVVLAGFMLYAASTGGFRDVFSNLSGSILTPIQQFSAQISGSVHDFLSKFVNADAVAKENEELKEEIRRLNDQMVDYEQYRNENEQFREFLDIKEENPDLEFEPALVTGRDPASRFYSFTINKGSRHGIEPRDAVITPDGLVGIVDKVGYTYATVITVLDPSVNVGCYNTRTQDTGISTGSADLAEGGQCKMEYISRDSTASPGDLITSSGVGGGYPDGLIVGTISDIQPESHGKSLYAVVDIQADVQNCKNVFVIKSFAGQEPAQEESGTQE